MTADEFLVWCFDSIIYIFKWSVNMLRNIPTGFGVSLWSLFIASFILTVITVAVINVVRVGPDSVFRYENQLERKRRNERSEKTSQKKEGS